MRVPEGRSAVTSRDDPCARLELSEVGVRRLACDEFTAACDVALGHADRHRLDAEESSTHDGTHERDFGKCSTVRLIEALCPQGWQRSR